MCSNLWLQSTEASYPSWWHRAVSMPQPWSRVGFVKEVSCSHAPKCPSLTKGKKAEDRLSPEHEVRNAGNLEAVNRAQSWKRGHFICPTLFCSGQWPSLDGNGGNTSQTWLLLLLLLEGLPLQSFLKCLFFLRNLEGGGGELLITNNWFSSYWHCKWMICN